MDSRPDPAHDERTLRFKRELREGEKDENDYSDDQLTPEGLRGNLRGWGLVLIAVGIAHLFIPFLDSLWAFVILPLGVLSLFVAHRGMFIAIGAALVLVGLLNIFGGGFGSWTIMGGVQIYWGGTRVPQVWEVRVCVEAQGPREH